MLSAPCLLFVVALGGELGFHFKYREVNLCFACAWEDAMHLAPAAILKSTLTGYFHFHKANLLENLALINRPNKDLCFGINIIRALPCCGALMNMFPFYVSLQLVLRLTHFGKILLEIGDSPPLTLHAFVSCYDCLHMVNKELETQPSNV